VQASGTAIMMPLLMTTVMTLVPPEARGKKMGDIMMVISVAPALGPVLSGLILNYLHWRWLFVLVLPIALFSLWLGWRRIENVTTPRKAPLDLASVVISILAFGGSVYGVGRTRRGRHRDDRVRVAADQPAAHGLSSPRSARVRVARFQGLPADDADP